MDLDLRLVRYFTVVAEHLHIAAGRPLRCTSRSRPLAARSGA